jgi:1-aminocyclopropane-1-carboxylate deaminase/D-cysteine desulfhydrase-like pyridoxal-dependent ACC family enzyme
MRRQTTPIQHYLVRDRTVFVKREDLYAQPPAPPVAKLRGLELLLARLQSEGCKLVGCFEASVSTIGLGLAAACTKIHNMNSIVAYPDVRGRGLSPSLSAARDLGAELLPVRSNVVNVCYHQARKLVEQRGGFMIPFGFECDEALLAVESEARGVPRRYLEGGTLILCCGSGVTLAGLLRGLTVMPQRIVGVSSGRSVGGIGSVCPETAESFQTNWNCTEPTFRTLLLATVTVPFPVIHTTIERRGSTYC